MPIRPFPKNEPIYFEKHFLNLPLLFTTVSGFGSEKATPLLDTDTRTVTDPVPGSTTGKAHMTRSWWSNWARETTASPLK